MLENNKIEFIELLLSKQALKFGDFTLPSGNKTPYFFNIGQINSGENLDQLSIYYSDLIYSKYFEHTKYNKNNLPVIFGAAYKGIPLAATAASKMYQSHKISLEFACNRKEPKKHGEGGLTMGADIKNRDIIIIDDVIAEGVTLFSTQKFIEKYKANIKGVIVALDREDKVEGYNSAAQKVIEELNIPIYSIISFSDIIAYTKSNEHYASVHKKLKSYN